MNKSTAIDSRSVNVRVAQIARFLNSKDIIRYLSDELLSEEKEKKQEITRSFRYLLFVTLSVEFYAAVAAVFVLAVFSTAVTFSALIDKLDIVDLIVA